MSKLEHTVSFLQGYDCIRFECDSKSCKPGKGGSHGRQGLTIIFASVGPLGAVTFTLYTGWLPQRAEKSSTGRFVASWVGSGELRDPMPADLHYHALSPRYEDQSRRESCCHLDGKPCYYDGSVLDAYDAMYALVNGGGEALWKFLDAYYKCIFEDGEYPEPAEYPKPLRKEK